MTKSAMIRARVDSTLKEEVEGILKELGLSTTQAITLFYQQVRLTKGLPFAVRLPNQVTIQTFVDTDAGENLVRAENAQALFKKARHLMRTPNYTRQFERGKTHRDRLKRRARQEGVSMNTLWV